MLLMAPPPPPEAEGRGREEGEGGALVVADPDAAAAKVVLCDADEGNSWWWGEVPTGGEDRGPTAAPPAALWPLPLLLEEDPVPVPLLAADTAPAIPDLPGDLLVKTLPSPLAQQQLLL